MKLAESFMGLQSPTAGHLGSFWFLLDACPPKILLGL